MILLKLLPKSVNGMVDDQAGNRLSPESRQDVLLVLLAGYRLSSVWLLSKMTRVWEHHTIMRRLVRRIYFSGRLHFCA